MSKQSSELEACRESIRSVGLRVTPARVAVLSALRSATRPLSHADLCELLDESVWNRTTVWRNLTDLETAGLVRRAELGDRIWRFEEKQDHQTHEEHVHPHFICTSCGEVQCLPEQTMTFATVPQLPRALQQRHVEIQVRGVCDKCD